jgi:hypothetical protein
MRRCYFSKNYKGINSAGNKAKTDMEEIMDRMGFVNLGLDQTRYHSKIKGYLITLAGVIKFIFSVKKGDIVLLQYPLKKYYSFLCRITHLKGGKTVTLIHDLGAFRRKKLTPSKEKRRLSNTNYIIALNDSMKSLLEGQDYKQPIGTLKIWDYLSETQTNESFEVKKIHSIVYAGALSYKKNRFLYDIEPYITSYKLDLYGGGFDTQRVQNSKKFSYHGFTYFEDLIKDNTGDFGLVWDGESINTCEGSHGEYLRYNNPHKTSLYIRCGLPVIIWDQAAMADFIVNNGVGIKIDSLENLDKILSSISKEEYVKMKDNTIKLSKQLAKGYYFTQAYLEAEKHFTESE